ncbi:hypothetical protein MTsDn5_26240 [Alteromonas gracilis]|uniref:hypothetical protein n=1 Tax=Alteromonas gracilis TaxID=1479524 RepID=UPI0036F36094
MKVKVTFVVTLAILAVIYGFTNNKVSTEVQPTDFGKPLEIERKTVNPFDKVEVDTQLSKTTETAFEIKQVQENISQNTLEESYDAFALSPEAETVQNTDDAEMVVSVSLTEAPEGDFDGYSSTMDVPISSASKVETDDMESKQP